MTMLKRIYLYVVTILATFLLVGFMGPDLVPASSCQDCHKAKSRAYQHCRSIPPTDREARQRCFQKADRELQQCLKTCK